MILVRAGRHRRGPLTPPVEPMLSQVIYEITRSLLYKCWCVISSGQMTDYTLLIVCLVFGGLIGFLVLGYLVSNNKLKPPLLKPANAIYTLFSVAFVLLIVGGIVYLFVEESSWIPRTRE